MFHFSGVRRFLPPVHRLRLLPHALRRLRMGHPAQGRGGGFLRGGGEQRGRTKKPSKNSSVSLLFFAGNRKVLLLFVVVDQHLDANHGSSQVSLRRRLPRPPLPPARPVLMPRADHGGNQRILVPAITTGDDFIFRIKSCIRLCESIPAHCKKKSSSFKMLFADSAVPFERFFLLLPWRRE